MRTMKLALVLLALAVLIGTTMVAAVAATPTSMPISSPTKMPTKIATPTKIAKMSSLGQNAEGQSISATNNLASNVIKNQAAKITQGIMQNIAQGKGKTSNKVSLPGMGSIMPQLNHMGSMPSLSGKGFPAI